MSAVTAYIRAGTLIQRASVMMGIPEEDIIAARDQLSCEIRYGIVKVLRDDGYSLPQIGRILKRHHTTIMDAERRANDLIGDSVFAGFVEALR